MSKLAVVILTSQLLIGFLSAQAPITKSSEVRLTVSYTGRLLGYARIPESQAPDESVCPTEPTRISPFTNKMLDLSREAQSGIIVGMGNNFAPDLFARTYGPAAAQGDQITSQSNQTRRIMKDATDWDGKVDNVGCYFRRAHYDAIVPGKHDFLFGADRLRQLAGMLARKSLPGEESDRPVQMLAANLLISTTVANANPRVPSYLKDRHDIKYSDFTVAVPDLPDVVLPYMRQFRFQKARKILTEQNLSVRPEILKSSKISKSSLSENLRTLELSQDEASSTIIAKEYNLIEAAWVCKAPVNGKPNGFPLPPDNTTNCIKLEDADRRCSKNPKAGGICDDPNFHANKAHVDATYIFPKSTDSLEAGRNYGLCVKFAIDPVTNKVPIAGLACKPFAVRAPLLQYETKPGISTPSEWASAIDGAGNKVAIFGVLDPALGEHIGALNAGWLNANKRFDTAIELAAPDVALRQLLQKCGEDPTCASARKILLAQMPLPKAAQLIASFPSIFDLTLSESDYEHDTGEETQTRIISKTDSDGKRSGFVATPRSVYEPAKATEPGYLHPRIARATIIGNAPEEERSKWKFQNSILTKPDVHFLKPPAATNSLLTEANKLMQSKWKVDDSEASADKALKDLALLTMLEQSKADVAILQNRDLYDADRISSEEASSATLQNQLNRILWKGDFLVTVPVTGATLKKIAKRSKELDQLDKDSLSTELEKGRSCVFAGLTPDPNDATVYWVNGAPVDDAALYSVATTDYLGFGDTGYPDLKDSAVPGSMPKGEILHSLSGLVCTQLAKTLKNGPSDCDPSVKVGDYFDPSDQLPSDTTSGYTTLERYRSLRRFPGPKPPVLDEVGKGTAGNVAQQHGLWQLKLEYLDFSYSANLPKNPNASTASKFSGVPVTAVTSPGASSIQEDHRLRLTHDDSKLNWFALTESNYQRQLVRDKSTFDYTLSQPANTFAVESGFNPRLYHLWKRPAGLRALLSVRHERFQLWTDPDPTVFTFPAFGRVGLYQPVTADQKVQAPLQAPTARTNTLFGKAGLRWDSGDTWVEGGYQDGVAFSLVDRYEFANPQFTCGAASDQPLQKCFTNEIQKYAPGINTTVSLKTRNAIQEGIFLNFNLKFPIWAEKSIYFTLANRGTFFFQRPDDRSVDTRYLDILTPSLSLPLFGKFTLKPKVDVLLYENKVAGSRFRSIQPSLALQYQFDWRPGLPLKRTFLYDSTLPPPANSPAPKK